MSQNLFSHPFTLRPFQVDFQGICDEIIGGAPIRDILAAVTPGGGKSSLPVILAAKLIPHHFIDGICWVAPRKSLQVQGEMAFLKEELRRLLGHEYRIRTSTNEGDPSRGRAGYITTIQAIAQDDSRINLREFTLRRYALIVDESHHIHTGGEWDAAIRPLVNAAALRLFMMGSFVRHDRKRISFVPYTSPLDGAIIDLAGKTPGWAKLHYTRKQSLRDRATIRVQFNLGDGSGEWTDRNGEVQAIDSFDEAEDCLPDALYTALKTGYAYQLLDNAVREWRKWSRFALGSKLLVVAADIQTAKQYLAHLKQEHGLTAALATSEDSKDAGQNIERFREGSLGVLVTVAMAYEGLDVPAVTHVACLTHIRSYPWIEQMIARATRYDPEAGPWESQMAFVFAPDDPQMRRIIDRIYAEQAEAVVESPAIARPEGAERPPREARPEVIPHASSLHTERISGIDGDTIPPHLAAWIARERERLSLHISETDIYRLLTRYAECPPEDARPASTRTLPPTPDSQLEADLRAQIQKRASLMDIAGELDPGSINRRLRDEFKKSRADMTLDELRGVWAFLNRLDGVSP